MKSYLIRLVVSSFIIATSMVVFKPLNAQDKPEFSGFACYPENLYNRAPPPLLTDGKDARIVKEITDKLGVPTINVYDMRRWGLEDAFAVKPVPGARPMFKADPKFEGIIVNSHHMDINVDVTKEQTESFIAEQERRKKQGLKAIPEPEAWSINRGKMRRWGVLAHEVAHMLLPDLRGLIGKNAKKEKIAATVPHLNVQKMIENLNLNPISSDVERQFVNEMAADYVTGGILGYMNVGTAGVKYMLKMYDLSGSSNCHRSHLSLDKRRKVIQMGYDAHIIK